MIQDMKTILTRMFIVVVLMMISMGIDAQVKVDLGGEKNDGIYPGGTIVEKGQTKPDDNGLVTVTITVTPKKGFTISQKDITVVSTYDPSNGTRSDNPKIAANLTPIEKDPKDLSEPRDYSYIVSSTFGVWVKEANFHNPDDAGKGSMRSTTISSLSAISDADGSYVIGANISGGTPGVSTFNGTLEAAIDPDTHMPYRISGLSAPLFETLTGTVKNLVLEGVSISGHTGNTGAIACTANGDARIYNVGILSGSVGGTAYTGGLVGQLDGSARVVNCYSYANITGGTDVGGIVGHNNVATDSRTDHLKTMVFGCMFYGDITGGTTIAPIYNGENIVNKDANGVSNYNYFRLEAPYVKPTGVVYNCALGAEERFLKRFEFFRHVLNSHRELAGWWATGTYSNSEMLKWVLEPSQLDGDIPYPILKVSGKYPSVVNLDKDNLKVFSTDEEKKTQRNQGRKFGTLAVTIQMDDPKDTSVPYHHPGKDENEASITTSGLSLPITDKDPDHYNFNYYKVQLPYYNDVGTKNYNGNRVVTGWKIVSITGGTPGTFSTSTSDAPSWNFADRSCTNKDLYSESGRVFNQGAYWDVPEGVTAITIEPYWAKAAYVADAYPDVVYNTGMSTAYNVPNVGGGQKYTNNTNYVIAGEQQKVYTTVANAVGALSPNASHTVNDYAVVLVGNVHQYVSGKNTVIGNTNKYTVTTIDLDGDNEPDYSFMFREDNRNEIHPLKWDFLNLVGLGMAQKSTGGTGSYNLGILIPSGWFETTNTALFRFTQFEYENSKITSADALILQGGVMEQWVSSNQKGTSNNIPYIHVGGNVWFKEFHTGCHQDKKIATKHPPISVTGGDYDEFYLTGLYRGDVGNYTDNAECYVNGGQFGIVAGAAMEGIGKTNGANNTGNITWQLQNADITEFYGGGINAAHPVEGNISTTITGGYIKQFCGGPKFGDMRTGKTVTTTANGCIFDTFYGAGYGGNSYSRRAPNNQNNKINIDWNNWVKKEYTQKYDATYGGVETQFNYQFLPMSGNADNVCRLFVEYVKFSLATTLNVTSNLTDCTITGNFYGGGKLGKVDGPVTSTLSGCTVNGDVFGAGYSGATPPVEVDDPTGFETEPYYYNQLGTYRVGVKKPTTTYTWQHGNSISVDNTNHILYTTEDLTALGTVTGKATLNIDGTTVTGNVYGGGESSDATGEVEVNVKAGKVYEDVYGGGKGETTVVGGDVVVNIGTKTGEGSSATYNGTGTVNGNVYGGSALGAVNAIKDPSTKALSEANGKTANVYVYSGTVNGSVFGGGLGVKATGTLGQEDYDPGIAAQNFGNTTVTIENSDNTKAKVVTAVYGGSNANGVLKQKSTVTITGGTVGTLPTGNSPVANVVFGGGFGQPTLVEGNVEVNIGTRTVTTTGTGDEAVTTANYNGNAIINGNVYGGSALGNTNARNINGIITPVDGTKTDVNLFAGTINGNVFGGGLGVKATGTLGQDDYDPGIAAYVGGDVTVTLDGAKLSYTFTGGKTEESDNRTFLTGQIFGANNLNGTPKGHVKVHVSQTVNTDNDKNALKNNSTTALDARTTYDVAAVYGGGNQADYNPTKASGTENDKKEAFAEVEIEGCDKTSIEYVYGGGNAAAVPATQITIKSAYIIDQIFGGGNGAGTGNPGADVGVIDKDAYETNHENGIYGTGIATTKLIGGQVHVIYGGSNTKGNVRGGTSLERKDNSAECPLKIGEIYGAGQVAPMDGDVNIILECMPEDFVPQVFGGAKNATINGNVTLTVTSGKFGRVFGGNNEGGSINGSITVNVYEEGCEPLIIGELYGGGYMAPYSIYGCTQSGETWTANEDGTLYFDQTAKGRAAVEVNVYSCTSIGKVFGGGFQAPVIGNTHVWINTMQGIVNSAPKTYSEGVFIGKIGQVFGGGFEGIVKGDATIDIGTASIYKYNTEVPAEKVGVNIIKGTDYLDPSDGSLDQTLSAGVYGGGYSANVEGNTTLNIGTVEQNQGINIAGDIFGGGLGEGTKVTGNVTVNIGTNESGTPVGYAVITGDVYGGSAKGKVNTVDGSTTNTYKPNPNEETTAECYTQVNLYGGTITGNLYGGGEGQMADSEAQPAVPAIAANVYGPVTVTMEGGSVYNVFGCNNYFGAPHNTVTVNINGGTVDHSEGETEGKEGNVYGGGNKAAYTAPNDKKDYPVVNINNGTVTRNVFGGGLGTTATVTGNPHVSIGDNVEGHIVAIKQSVYGGGSLASVDGSTNIVVNSGTIGTPKEGETVYGGATYGNIYGGGFGSDTDVRIGLVKGNTEVTVNGGTILHNVYGGGAYGSVGTYTYKTTAANAVIDTHTENTGKATIKIKGGTIGTDGHNNGMVFGSSRGDIDAIDAIQDNMAWVYDTDVQVGIQNDQTSGPTIHGSLYGGGENGHVFNDASVTMYSGTVGDMDEYYAYRGNVYGGGCGTDLYYSGKVPEGHTKHDGEGDKYNPKAGIVHHNATVLIKGGNIANNVYGAGSMGKVEGSTSVTIDSNGSIGVDGNHDDGNVYGAARGELNLKENNHIRTEDNPDDFSSVMHSSVEIKNGTVKGNVFGGGKAGIVKGNVDVKVRGGVVKNDVYGGGALANTNTDNWSTSGSATTYDEVTDLATREYYSVISITVGQSVEGYYKFNGSTYVAATGTAVKGETYYQRLTNAPIAGYYTKSGDVYTLQTSGNAEDGTTYYKKVVVGSWAEGKNNNETGTVNKTNVILTGGSVGNVYGGGLGSSTVAANVYGDVKVTVNKPEELTSTGGTGIAFSCKSERVTFGEGDKSKEYVIPLTGRVFGCNNINGTPTGNVRVEVYSTRQADEDGKLISNTEHSPNSNNNRYEIQGVYGGGNLSDYLPAEGKATSVYIGECDVTSIEKVYGGGNSASVPTSNVTINGSFDLGYAFGGGNGGDLIKKDGVWYENAGAIVISQAYIAPIGGKIGAVFGGSDAKGNCGSIVIDKSQTNENCPLRLLRLYGAGNEADVDEVNITISGCSGGDNAEIEYVYGGSYNANVEHDVKLTITAGKFKNIYGGNDRTGSIGGNIIVNIEETDNCMPITIQNLLGGGYQAPYPGTKRNGTEITTPGKITVNVKSATRIDNIYGGSFKADVNGDTEVNINMTKGWWAGKEYESEAIADAVGSIGNIYGGGNQGLVRGNSTVNIATATTVGYVTEPVHLRANPETPIPQTDGLYVVPVTGARITGDVFGGGNEANVNGNAIVNICTADYSGVTGFEGVSISDGSVYGGGNKGDVLGNTNVTMHGGYVFNGIFGGGLSGSVGTFERSTAAADIFGHKPHEGCIGKPIECTSGGKCTILVDGGQIGPVEVATKGMSPELGGPVIEGWIWGGGCGLVEDPADNPDTHFTAYVNETDVTVDGSAFVLESVIGGGEFGRVLGNTLVKIKGGQIGVGENQTEEGGKKPKRYTEAQWTAAAEAVASGNAADINAAAADMPECSHYVFGKNGKYLPYDPYYDEYSTTHIGPASTSEPSDGQTWIGCVFGGGSGYMPYKKKDGSGYEWMRSAGWVEGNTTVEITGGHILSNVYGGNEFTDVKGKSTVKMSGGTLGVPRTLAQIAAHPLGCYLFGAGKGDQRAYFNEFNNVGSVLVEVSGGIIYGSVFGGAEDGHVLGDVEVNIKPGAMIGTWGTSYVDGNVFGGGRGFSGENLEAGSIGGDIDVNITGGTMLGSVYGGGRMASVGIGFTSPDDDSYGQLVDDTNEKTHGYISIDISGGTIGNAYEDITLSKAEAASWNDDDWKTWKTANHVPNTEFILDSNTEVYRASHTKGGNVFGGNMGRITLLDGTLNPLWPKLAVAKQTDVIVSGTAEIKNSVYGGSEYGIVRDLATVNVSGGTIEGNVFGGGYGSDDNTPTLIKAGGYEHGEDYVFTPMIWTGCVSGDTKVNISGGQVKKNVYGGGEVASVGLFNCHVVEDNNGDISIETKTGTKKYRYTDITKHDDIKGTGADEKAYGFALSWPYEFQYIPADPKSTHIGGKATVTVTGGRIGTGYDNGTGYVFGASKGQVAFKKKVGDELVDITDIHEQRYTEAFCANVRETAVNINYGSTPIISDPQSIGADVNCIMGAVYGGGEDGHVYENAAITFTNGLTGLSIYGGGKGESTYTGTKYVYNESTKTWTKTDNVPGMPSWTAGKVYGNTSITMTGGHVSGNVYGGGNLGSVGKGNYAGGTDDYYPAGYGETLQNAALWTTSATADNPDYAWHFLNSGKCTISITGGEVGTLNGLYGYVYGTSNGTPTGMIFGGSRGRAARDVGALSPRYEYAPDFFLGYVNNTEVTIGTRNAATGPTIYSQVFGGARDGHVRGSAKVEINSGIIGQTYAQSEAYEIESLRDYQRYHRGNVYGSGSGLGTWDGTHHGTSSGSVTRNTTVDIYGGTIYNNVYGGGAMATVGPPKIGSGTDYATADRSKCTVNIYGGTIGDPTVYNTYKYGGTIYGGSRGDRGGDLAEGESIDNYATVLWTEVNINPHTTDRSKDAVIAGNVYGGARGGEVKKDTKVNLTGGIIKHNVYGGGRGTTDIAANVLGNTAVELNNGVAEDAKGCIVDKVFGCNDLNGTPKGHVTVHVYATQHAGKETISDKIPPVYKSARGNTGYKEYLQNLVTAAKEEGGLSHTSTEITAAESLLSSLSGKAEDDLDDTDKTNITNAANAIITELDKLHNYDVTAVYGGGDLAPYEPAVDEDKTEVIIEGCGTTSIKQVYGGGNAASVPATDVNVKSCFIIDEVFGGGNGKDNYVKDGRWYENPGAHVGYTQFAYYVTDGTHGTGEDEAHKYEAVVPTEAAGNTEAAKAYRQEHYRYGTGVATTTINGGHIHNVYGGSNEKGNVSGEARSGFQQIGTCAMVYDEAYGGGKNADTDAETNTLLDCVDNDDNPSTIYGGSFNANINSDVNIHITNGSYDKIFGGNNEAGTINGKITIIIEEYGCTPVKINELYAGGNLAPYSVYGYKTETAPAKDKDGNDREGVQQRIPYRAGEIGALTTPYWDPRIIIISATSIGKIYGGGYGAGATMIGNPHVNVNMTEGKIRSKYNDYKPEYATLYPDFDGTGEDKNRIIPIGTIGTIYGGGNLASVEGDTYVEIGTGQWIASWDANGNPVWESTTANGDKYSYKEKTAAVYYTQAECDTYNSDAENHVTGYIASGKVLTAEEATAVNKTLGTSYVEGAELLTKDANAYNAKLPNAKQTTDVKSRYETQAECDEYNATLNGALNSTDPLSAADAAAYNTAMSASKSAGDLLSPEEANAYNAKLSGAKKIDDVKSYYTQAECDEENKNLPNYIPKHKKLTAEEATRVNNTLTPSYVSGNTISEADRNAYNATLPNARKTTDVKTEAVWAWYDEDGTEMTTPPTLAPRNAATITGNVFGGGKGEAKTSGTGAFECAKGMVGVDGDGIDYPEGGTSVIIANGTIGTIEEGKLKAGTGNVYGGGEIGRVEKNTIVTIGMTPEEGETISTTKFKPTIFGSVFGAGKGVDTHGYSALVRGNSNVTIQGFAKVGESVYGGGEIASIGRYNVVGGIPTSLKNPNSGNCVVTVRDNAEIGPDDMTMFHVDGNGVIVANDNPDNSGHVFGAGKGATPGVYSSAKHITKDNEWLGFGTEKAYLDFIETLALATHTDVTIGGNAFVKGDVFGGAEQGFVQHDTHVTIEGDCQIGNGYVQMADDGTYLDDLTTKDTYMSVNRRYTPEEWAAGHLIANATTEAALYDKVNGKYYQHSLPECASWKYKAPYSTHDIFAQTTSGNEEKYSDGSSTRGGRRIATNGHTFYGNVFGGGSGYFPYAAGKWHWKAGDVGGNTFVEIKGGHILTNVYGGNEMTNVSGKCTVTMSGGTIGVPRTLGQIAAHPVTCYLFGAGKGDTRVFFNKQTNVQDVEVNVTGGWIYGSALGGGEDGHVMRNVTMNISGQTLDGTPVYADYYAGRATKIGTWGTSSVDGNIFGGGRGFTGEAYTAGNVAGAVTMNIAGGEILGSVYGGGRLGSVGYGLYEEGADGYGEMRDDDKMDDGTDGTSFFTKGRGHVDITITGGTIGNTNEFIMPKASNIPTGLNADFKEWSAADWTTWKNTNHVPNTTYDTSNGRILHTKGGNVYAGGMGRFYKLDGNPISTYDESTHELISPIEWTKLGSVKSAKVTISGENTWIMGDVYGGGELGSVMGTHDVLDSDGNPVVVNGKNVVTGTEVIIKGGTIGTEMSEITAPQKATIDVPETPESDNSDVKYTYGSVYGGGEGKEEHDTSKDEDHGGKVLNDARVDISGNTKVRASVYGGGELALVGGDTYVNISGGEIGRNEVKSKSSDNPGNVMFGGATMGNVYGGGKGSINHYHTGQVKGNTNVNITGGNIYHMVYGGGALASVGTFDRSDGNGHPPYMPVAGIPYQWYYDDGVTVIDPAETVEGKTPTGTATVTITGGVIGINGRDNGLVFGSSRGDIMKPEGTQQVDPCDKVAWVNKTVVNIGTEGSNDLSTPIIKGSVYGGGENGHNYTNATVNIYSGTIGIAEKDPADNTKNDPWWTVGDVVGNEEGKLDEKYRADRGNVYGAGSGSDTYSVTVGEGSSAKTYKYHNPRAGMVGGNTFVNIAGGHIGRSVYGAGAMASVGNIINGNDTTDVNKAKHFDKTKGFALSWPYKFVFAPGTGKATINVTGGHVGTKDVDGGDVFGGARGEAGDRYATAHLAYVNEAEVNVNYSDDDMTTAKNNISNIKNDLTIPCVTGAVSGSGEDGYVYGDTHVTLNNGLIGHSLYGAGKGKGTYTKTLNKIGGDGTYDAKIYSLIAGKVLGNTYVTMRGGYVGRNVYGGGNMASVGKGSYASGSDDYAYDCEIGKAQGYGETLNGNAEDNDKKLWDSSANDNSAAFLSSGKTTVNVISGTVGYIDATNPANSMKNELPYGNVIGGSAGEAAPNITEDPRYEYSPAFFSGYVNETDVTIGGYRCKTAYDTYKVGDCLTAKEYNTKYPLGNDNWELVGPTILASVYGGGQDGHVRRDTKVTVLGGEIGLPFTDANKTLLKTTSSDIDKVLDDPQWLHRGNVYGGGSGITKYKYDFNYDGNIDDTVEGITYDGQPVKEEDYSNSSGSVTRFTEVNILGGIIHRNVYGGGSMGSVGAPNMGQEYAPYKKGDTATGHGVGKQSQNTVNIGGGTSVVTIGTPNDTPKGWTYNQNYGGEVYGACRGMSTLNAEEFSTSVWTQVNIKDKATIMGNVFGGGDSGIVKKDTEVNIGEAAPATTTAPTTPPSTSEPTNEPNP